ncbi:MAG: hypothetical protein ACJAS6_000879 [Rickettsiales bacterium]|jgi:hypothetical protein
MVMTLKEEPLSFDKLKEKKKKRNHRIKFL